LDVKPRLHAAFGDIGHASLEEFQLSPEQFQLSLEEFQLPLEQFQLPLEQFQLTLKQFQLTLKLFNSHKSFSLNALRSIIMTQTRVENFLPSPSLINCIASAANFQQLKMGELSFLLVKRESSHASLTPPLHGFLISALLTITI